MNQKVSVIDGGELAPTRLEALTDGIFAIAMTLLVLELHVPMNVQSPADFYNKIIELLPHILGFGLSFVILGMFWVAHHTEFRYIKKLDNRLIWLNVFYLLFVSLLPFSTALLGEYYFLQLPVAIYGIHLIVMVFLQFSVWRRAFTKPGLLKEDADPRLNGLSNLLCFAAVTSYIIALAISFWSLPVTLAIYAIVPIPYITGWIYKI